MNRRTTLTMATLAAVCLGLALPAGNAIAEQKGPLTGSWSLVSATVVKDGKNADFYGANPLGSMTFDAAGHFSVVITRADVAKFASNNRETGTADENKAATQGSIAYFGNYSADAGTANLHIDGSSFPNWRGTDQKRTFTVSGDDLSWTNPIASSGAGAATLHWKRIK